jgi:hypothetical protein
MTTSQTFGRIRDRSEAQGEYLQLAFSPLSVPLRSRWRNNGLSADFLGDYVLTFLPSEGESVPDGATQNEIKHAVVFIANELLENAMKYHEKNESTPIDIHMELTSEFIAVSARNTVSRHQAQQYQSFIESLMREEASELLVKQLEINASAAGNSSCLGLLTMVTDYGAELGWQFEEGRAEQESTLVTTSALLSLNKIVGVPE